MKRDSSASDRIFHRPMEPNAMSRSTNSVNSNNMTTGEQDDQDGESKSGKINWRQRELENSRIFNTRNSLNGFCLKPKRSAKGAARLLDQEPPKHYGSLDKGERRRASDEPGPAEESVAVSDIIGSFGWFQFMVLLFSGLRECMVGYDALIMSVILQPEKRFLCAENLSFEQLSSAGNMSAHGNVIAFNMTHLFDEAPGQQQADWNETRQCFRYLDGERPLLDAQQRPVECQNWLFPDRVAEQGPSLVAEWSLVCQNHWLVAFIESAYFFGLVSGNLVWGYTADRIGRRPAYLAAHSITLVFGALAVMMPSIWLFALCRYLSAFGAIGYNIIYSIQVEIIGVKHRSFSTILNHLGWGLGVILIPFVDHWFDDYRAVLALAPILTLVMFPWAFWLPESSRWLSANGQFARARVELIRAAKFNGKVETPQMEKKIAQLEQRQVRLAGKQKSDGSQAQLRSYSLIFTNRTLVKDTLILSYLAFTGHLFYYVLTINFAYMKNLSFEANFITSGAGEWVSVVVGAIMLKFLSRRACMSLFLLTMAASFLFQSLVDSELTPSLDTPAVITTNNGIGTLSALLLVFIVLIVNQEVYPTVVRQTGTSLTNTVGESGSTLAPLLIQLSRMVGAWQSNIFYSLICTLGMVAVQFVTKTDDIELPDNVDNIDTNTNYDSQTRNSNHYY